MKLTRLVYFSFATRPMGLAATYALAVAASRNNLAADLTGKLYFDGEMFIQILEGDLRAVNRTFQCISKDTRHRDPCILSLTEQPTRLFSDWSMAYSRPGSAAASVLRRYGVESLDPLKLSAWEVVSIMSELPTLEFPALQTA